MTRKGRDALRLLAILLTISIIAVCARPAIAATISISGTIVDANGLPVPGATASTALSGLTGLQVAWGYPSQAWEFYDPNNSSGALPELCPGAGYWIEVNQAATWTMPSN
ncbi:MAG: hypothetical protein ABSC19_10240 [Syntrophorhabdales bacterium]|jgi:hypothetical protein